MHVALISTYDLGHQPFGLASPAAWLRDAGARVTCHDLSVDRLDEAAVRSAGLIAVHVPMHTATRLAAELAPRLRALNPAAHLAFFGLYAPANADRLRALGGETVLGGETEQALVDLYRRLAAGRPANGAQAAPTRLDKLQFRLPDRSTLPPPAAYAKLIADGDEIVAGYTEASRGCKHLCRHCPVVPVYGGRFRVVAPDVVLADIAQQVASGARHVSFGDPDFLNGPRHARTVVERLHAEFPHLTYDATIKVEHLLKHADLLPVLAATGCLFVTTAVEALDDRVLDILDKGHTRADVFEATRRARAAGLTLAPTFVTFTPWTTRESFAALLRDLADLRLVDNVAPVQLAIRLLLPQGSLLLRHPAMQPFLGPFDADALSYRWQHPDARVDALFESVRDAVTEGEAAGRTRRDIFARVWRIAHVALGQDAALPDIGAPAPVPHMSEPWYCCAEPTDLQRCAPSPGFRPSLRAGRNPPSPAERERAARNERSEGRAG